MTPYISAQSVKAKYQPQGALLLFLHTLLHYRVAAGCFIINSFGFRYEEGLASKGALLPPRLSGGQCKIFNSSVALSRREQHPKSRRGEMFIMQHFSVALDVREVSGVNFSTYDFPTRIKTE